MKIRVFNPFSLSKSVNGIEIQPSSYADIMDYEEGCGAFVESLRLSGFRVYFIPEPTVTPDSVEGPVEPIINTDPVEDMTEVNTNELTDAEVIPSDEPDTKAEDAVSDTAVEENKAEETSESAVTAADADKSAESTEENKAETNSTEATTETTGDTQDTKAETKAVETKAATTKKTATKKTSTTKAKS